MRESLQGFSKNDRKKPLLQIMMVDEFDVVFRSKRYCPIKFLFYSMFDLVFDEITALLESRPLLAFVLKDH